MSFLSDLFKSKAQLAKERHDALVEENIQRKKALAHRLHRQATFLELDNELALTQKKNAIPVVAARNKLASTFNKFKLERNRLNEAWNKAYAEFSWWNKLNHAPTLDLHELDNQIKDISNALIKFESTYSDDLSNVEYHFQNLEIIARRRIEKTHNQLIKLIEADKLKSVSGTTVASAWIAGLSIPVSVVGDLYAADQVFNALRAVNGNFENMSNVDIWWETLWMSPESLAGLASLTKGAYFEQLVATDTDGVLFEHFNHADTDIAIDGIEFQIKATDSVSYINSVDDDIPVMTTSEVAADTGSIDSGYSDAELTNTVDLAIGGTVIDAQDTSIDAILMGVGSLGVFATLNGINHAQAQYDRGVQGEEAILNGLGVAVEGTAKGVVDASEMVFKAATSRPMRFVGRGLLKGLKKLDEKMTQKADMESRR